MFAEKENDKKERTGFCGCCDGTFEMIKGCFPDDAGYAADLARMKKYWGKFCGQKDSGAAKREK